MQAAIRNFRRTVEGFGAQIALAAAGVSCVIWLYANFITKADAARIEDRQEAEFTELKKEVSAIREDTKWTRGFLEGSKRRK